MSVELGLLPPLRLEVRVVLAQLGRVEDGRLAPVERDAHALLVLAHLLHRHKPAAPARGDGLLALGAQAKCGVLGRAGAAHVRGGGEQEDEAAAQHQAARRVLEQPLEERVDVEPLALGRVGLYVGSALHLIRGAGDQLLGGGAHAVRRVAHDRVEEREHPPAVGRRSEVCALQPNWCAQPVLLEVVGDGLPRALAHQHAPVKVCAEHVRTVRGTAHQDTGGAAERVQHQRARPRVSLVCDDHRELVVERGGPEEAAVRQPVLVCELEAGRLCHAPADVDVARGRGGARLGADREIHKHDDRVVRVREPHLALEVEAAQPFLDQRYLVLGLVGDAERLDAHAEGPALADVRLDQRGFAAHAHGECLLPGDAVPPQL
mmetsp:Transcript_1521/g.3992  ORF Transcript_1521/g.3992 Transcript_1521/m.3992 type:complete len:376 (+) Transcript_1521:320-1447(+)